MGVSNGVSPAESLLEPSEPVQLGGRTRLLKMGFNFLCCLEEKSGTNPFADPVAFEGDSPVRIRLLVWAALWDEKPRPSLEEVGSWLVGDWSSVTQALARLREKTSPKAKAGKQRPR